MLHAVPTSRSTRFPTSSGRSLAVTTQRSGGIGASVIEPVGRVCRIRTGRPCLAHGKTERPETSLQAAWSPAMIHGGARAASTQVLSGVASSPQGSAATTRPPVKNVSSLDDSGSDPTQ